MYPNLKIPEDLVRYIKLYRYRIRYRSAECTVRGPGVGIPVVSEKYWLISGHPSIQPAFFFVGAVSQIANI